MTMLFQCYFTKCAGSRETIFIIMELTILLVAEKPTATHVLAAVVTETLNSTLRPLSLTSQVSTYDGEAEGDQVPLH